MSSLLRSAALLLCAGMMNAQASEAVKKWDFNIGAMYEIENVEGQGDDKDGLYEPSVWFNATYDAWTVSLAMYQEGPVDYSSMTRGTYFDRPEFELRYRFIGSDDFTLGLTGDSAIMVIILKMSMVRKTVVQICNATKSNLTGISN